MARSYLIKFFVFLTVCILSLTALNWVVNPFSLYPSPLIDGFNKDKVEFIKYLRLTKVYQVYRDGPDAIILGTSRSGRGLSPAHPAWGDDRVYNLALPAGSMYENFRLLQHAHAAKPLRRVVLGLDFRLFNETGVNPAFSEGRLLMTPDGSSNPNHLSAVAGDLFSTLISGTALQASLNTIRFQGWNSDALFADGRWDRTKLTYRQRKAFAAYTKASIKRLQKVPDTLQGLDHYHKLLEFAHKENINLILVISPSHATHWVLLERMGLWSKFEQLKRDLVRINLAASIQADKRPFPLWDFSGLNSYSIEAIPQEHEPEKMMQWFWESIHYRVSLGDLVLDKVIEDSPDKQIDGDFGIQLMKADLDSHITGQYLRLRAYVDDRGEEVKFVDRILTENNLLHDVN